LAGSAFLFINMILAFLFLSLTVDLTGDTLTFYQNNAVAQRLVLGEKVTHVDGAQDLVVLEQARISPDRQHYLLYTESYRTDLAETIATRLALYDAGQRRQWEIIPADGRMVSFPLTAMYDGFIILGTTDLNHRQPQLEIIDYRKKVKATPVRAGTWQQMVKYELSPNRHYLAAHVKNPVNAKLWDYIYFIDLREGTDWNVPFPFCLSCTRGTLTLKVDDDGRLDVKYKNEHRIYSSTGQLLDAYAEM